MVKLLQSTKLFSLIFLSKNLSHKSQPLTTLFSHSNHTPSFLTITTMSINTHAFAGNPLISKTQTKNDLFSPTTALETLKSRITDNTHHNSPNFKVLPFRNGKPLATASSGESWRLGWIGIGELLGVLNAELNGDLFVYLGSDVEEDAVYWTIDVSGESGFVAEFGGVRFSFVELRTLMVATDWVDNKAMGNLAIAGHARALLEWHNISRFCGHCGEKTVPMEGGRRKQCSNESCKKRIYPRVDPVVIMLVIDRENDRALLSKQARFVPRMWSCLAGFIEPGESLEEAVRRETWEETGIEVGEVVYHSSQPWPETGSRTQPTNNCSAQTQTESTSARDSTDSTTRHTNLRFFAYTITVRPIGPNSMPCQLMVGFFAYAKSLEINVDKKELEDAQWHSREDVRKALTFAEYKKAQTTAAAKVEQMCKGVEKTHSLSTDFNVESGELAPMFVPGPFAIAHHLISAWAFPDQNVNGIEFHSKQPSGSVSNL